MNLKVTIVLTAEPCGLYDLGFLNRHLSAGCRHRAKFVWKSWETG
jgi:hypothetical protein